MPTIKSLETFHNEFVAFVKVTTEDGATGWGQTSTYNADITADVFHRQVAPWALGAAVESPLSLLRRIERLEHKYPGSYLCRAMAGLDTALWDLMGKQAGKPVASLIGGGPKKIRAYASSMKRDIAPEAEAERLKRLCGEKGFTAAKWRIGAEFGEDVDQWPGRTEAIIPMVSRALGDGIEKLVDANSAFSVARAIDVGHRLEDHGIGHYEEPVEWWDYEGLRAVREALAITDVAAGEQEFSIDVLNRMVTAGSVDIIQPDIMYLGGIARTLEVCRAAERAGLPVTPHSANLSLVTMATMHLLAAIPNAGKYLELSIEEEDYYPWQNGLFLGDPFAVTDGHVTVSDEPGFGLTINPAWLERATHKASIAGETAASAYNALYHKPRESGI